MHTAKIFRSGNLISVQLPAGFTFDGEEARVRRQGGALILEPIPTDWEWLDRIVRPIDPDFEAAANEPPEQQQRPELDALD